MQFIARIIALIGLAITIITPILATIGILDLERTKVFMLVGMIVWFIGAIPWLAFNKLRPSDSEVEI
jgi:hypothetical protein